MKILIPMTKFVLEQAKLKNDSYELVHLLIDYAKFLEQKLELWMFVPCKLVDGFWVVLEEPTQYQERFFYTDKSGVKWQQGNLLDLAKKEYQEAKDRVLFEGFSIENEFINLIMHSSGWGFVINNMSSFTIEFYANTNYNVTLTPTAQKQIGL